MPAHDAIITLPIFKDAAFLSKTVHILEDATSSIVKDFQILIAEDGSNSSTIVAELKRNFSNITYVQHDQRLGRGRALREAWSTVDADTYVYLDVDMATSLEHFEAYSSLFTLQQEYDLVTGSRYLHDSVTDRPLARRIASLSYNWFIRVIFKTKVHDHQCGFKSFSRKLAQTLSTDAKSDSWFWDTEAIVIARHRGFRIKEIPIYWTEKKGRRTPMKRLAKDIWLHGTGLLILFWRIYVRREIRT